MPRLFSCCLENFAHTLGKEWEEPVMVSAPLCRALGECFSVVSTEDRRHLRGATLGHDEHGPGRAVECSRRRAFQ